MYSENTQNNSGIDNIFVSFERTDIIQTSSITFYCNRFSIRTNNPLKSMARFGIQLLVADSTWSTSYNIPRNARKNNSSTDWILVSLYSTGKNYGIKINYDQIYTALGEMCCSNFTSTLSVY